MFSQVETHLEVRWGECDPAGIVYHPAYIDWFSIARMHFLSENGIQYMDTFHKEGVHLLVSDVACSYKKSLVAEQKITVVARVVELSRARAKFVYDVLNEDGELCATGFTRHAFVTDKTGRAVNMAKAAPDLWALVSKIPVTSEL